MLIDSNIQVAKVFVDKGVMHAVFEPETIVNISMAKNLVKYRLDLSNNKQFPLYVDIRGILAIDVEARNYLISEEATKLANAAAIHVGNPISKLLANLFLTVDKPIKPTRIFSDKTKALTWLKKYK